MDEAVCVAGIQQHKVHLNRLLADVDIEPTLPTLYQ